MAIYIEDSLPVVKYQGLNTVKNVDFSGATTVLLPAGTTINGSSLTALGTITSTSAQAFAVGRQGLTNPAFNVDASTATQLDGINIVGKGAGAGAAVSVITSGTNSPLTIDSAGSGTITIAGTSTGAITLGTAVTITAGALTVTSGNVTMTSGNFLFSAGTATVTSANALALAVGRLGATTPAFSVDASAGTQVTGLNVKGAATGGTVAVAVIQTAGNANLTVDAKGTGTVGINTVGTSSGIVTIGNTTSLLGAVVNGPVQVNNKTAAFNSTGTITAANLATGYITSTSAAGTNMTLPTGTAMGSQLGATQGTIFDFTIDNTAGANTFTVVVSVGGVLSAAAAANGASQGLLTIPSGATGQGQFRMMFSSATTFTFTRIA